MTEQGKGTEDHLLPLGNWFFLCADLELCEEDEAVDQLFDLFPCSRPLPYFSRFDKCLHSSELPGDFCQLLLLDLSFGLTSLEYSVRCPDWRE